MQASFFSGQWRTCTRWIRTKKQITSESGGSFWQWTHGKVRNEYVHCMWSVPTPWCRSFVTTPNTLVRRLTLFNGKGGGEPTRLTLVLYEECVKNEWIQKEDARWNDDTYVQWVMQEIKVAYQVAKGGWYQSIFRKTLWMRATLWLL